MHELAIARDIAEDIRRRAESEGLSRASEVRVELGALLRFDAEICSELLRQMLKDTPLKDAAFNVAEVPAAARCEKCGSTFDPDPDIPQCPRCESFKIAITAGQGWKVVSIK